MPDDNVIRPTFGTPRAGPRAAASDAPVRESGPELPAEPLRAFGTAAGHRVALVRDPSAPEGDVFRIVVGPEDARIVETVALLPATQEAETEADRIGFAVLRALEVVETALQGDA